MIQCRVQAAICSSTADTFFTAVNVTDNCAKIISHQALARFKMEKETIIFDASKIFPMVSMISLGSII